jgi:hypothetical protein
MDISYRGSTVDFHHPQGHAQGTSLCGTHEVIHMHSAFVLHDMQKRGKGSEYHRERLDWLESHEEYVLATCIVHDTNIAQKKILEKNGWKFLHKFKSKFDEPLWLCARDVVPAKYSPDQAGDSSDDI